MFWFSYSAVIVATMQWPVHSGVRIAAGPRDFYSLHKRPYPSHQTSYSMDTGAPLRGKAAEAGS
jgi:hypothetical protein